MDRTFKLSQVVCKLQKTYDAAFTPFGITPSQTLVLDQLWQEDGIQLKQLGVQAHLDPTSVNWLVAKLEEAGLAQRRRDRRDRRNVRLWLTPSGRELESRVVPAVRQLHLATEAVLLRYIPAPDLQTLGAALDGWSTTCRRARICW